MFVDSGQSTRMKPCLEEGERRGSRGGRERLRESEGGCVYICC